MLVIEKILDNNFSFSYNGSDPIRDNAPNLTTEGNLVNFKTYNGASIIKDQRITYDQVTVRDTFGGTADFNPASVGALWIKLIDLNFFYWLDNVGGGGSSTFAGLNDTDAYFGNDGKGVRVNESQQKLEYFDIYNVKDFIDLGDVEINALVENKIIGVTNIGGQLKLTLVDKPDEGTTYFSAVGGFDYNDSATSVTPLAYTTGDLQLTNDAQGAFTFLSQPPYGITNVWNEDTNTLDFSELSVGDEVFLRVHINVTTTSSNQVSGLKILFGEDTANEYEQPIDLQIGFKTAGAHDVLRELKFYIGNDEWKNTPAKILFNSDDNASVVVYGWHPYIIRKSINILDVKVQGGSEKLPFELATEGQTEIAIDSSADSVDVWIGSVFQKQELDFNRTSAGIVTMTYPLESGDIITKRTYTNDSVKETFLIESDAQASITLSNNPRSVDVINGSIILIEGVHYNKSNNLINFIAPYEVDEGDYITVRKYR